MTPTVTTRLSELAARVATLVRRVKEGKPLSARDAAWVERVSDVGSPGRPRGEGARIPIYETMRACSGATGIPLAALQLAKARGCSAFRGTRVHLDDFLRWWFDPARQKDESGNTSSNPDQKSTADWVREVKREDALMRRVRRERLEGTLVPRAWVCERIQKMCGELSALQARSESEHPVMLAAAGDDVAENRAVLRQCWDSIRDMLQELGEHLREGDPE